jgi:hypothetical protein
MSYVKPPVGSKVKVTIEGVVHSADDFDMRLESGVYMEWDSVEEAFEAITVEVVAPAYRMGDVAWRTDGDQQWTLFYMALPGRASGWYDHRGIQNYPEPKDLTLLARSDGSLALSLKRES